MMVVAMGMAVVTMANTVGMVVTMVTMAMMLVVTMAKVVVAMRMMLVRLGMLALPLHMVATRGRVLTTMGAAGLYIRTPMVRLEPLPHSPLVVAAVGLLVPLPRSLSGRVLTAVLATPAAFESAAP